MNCPIDKENLSAYIDKILSEDEMQQITAHLSECAECRKELAELQRTIELLSSLDEVIPPPQFRHDLRSKLEKAGRKNGFSLGDIGERLPRLRLGIWAPVAVVFVLLILIVPSMINSNYSILPQAAKSSGSAGNQLNYGAPTPQTPNDARDLTGGTAADKNLANQQTASESMKEGSSSDSTILTALLDRKIIKNADLLLQVESYEQALNQIKNQVSAVGGYVAYEAVYAQDLKDVIRGSLQARIPYEKFDAFMDGLDGLGKIQNRNIHTQDVTEQFVDVESRLNALKTKEERLLAILQKSGQLSDILAVENELANTRAEKESLEGKLRYLSNRVEYSTVTINLEQTAVPTQTISAGGLKGVFLKAREAFIKAVNNILSDTGKLIVMVFSAMPYLIIITVLVLVFWRWIRKKLG